jgi:hypothetical protein
MFTKVWDFIFFYFETLDLFFFVLAFVRGRKWYDDFYFTNFMLAYATFGSFGDVYLSYYELCISVTTYFFFLYYDAFWCSCYESLCYEFCVLNYCFGTLLEGIELVEFWRIILSCSWRDSKFIYSSILLSSKLTFVATLSKSIS